MIVKILSSASANFHGVEYNEKKIENGKGELVKMKNFPSFINENSSKAEVKDYLKAISKSKKVKKPQFHATISTKFREHFKEELTKIGEAFMKEMGYGNQPYIIVFHNDTENNHIHLVSTRVDKDTGKKIDDSYEKLKSQRALGKVMQELHGENRGQEIEKLLAYKLSTKSQLELLLQSKGYKLGESNAEASSLDILKNGVKLKTIGNEEFNLNQKKDKARINQLKAIVGKYKEIYSNQVFRVIDGREKEGLGESNAEAKNIPPKIEFQSELQRKLKEKFGIEIIFHHKDDRKPFGYSLIDHKTKSVYKGSEILKMGEVFQFTEQSIDKKTYETLLDFNIADEKAKAILLKFLQEKGNESVQDFMIYLNQNRKPQEVFSEVREQTKEAIKTGKTQEYLAFVKSDDGEFFAVNEQCHLIYPLEKLVGEKLYQKFIEPTENRSWKTENTENKEDKWSKEESVLDIILKSTPTQKDPFEDELKKRKRRKRR